MINVKTETLITVDESRALCPWRRRKKKGEAAKSTVSAATVWRWINVGVGGVKLESLLLGHVRYTSREAVDRFLEAVSAATVGEPIPGAETVKQRATRAARAAKEARAALYPEGGPKGRKPATAGQ
jgi:hypothetical protein